VLEALPTCIHLARFSLELLGNPSAEKLMMIASAAGLANNFSALKSLVTKGHSKGSYENASS
jgi:hydroxymethylglutaryl-CoA reductase